MGGGQQLTGVRVAGDVGATLAVLVCRVVLALVTSLAVIAIAPTLVGLTSTVVMSDSMAPGIRAGDVVVVRSMPTAAIRVGQVLLVDDPSFPGRLRLHRLAAREGGRFVLKGDANAQRDPTPVTAAAVHGVGFLRVPSIGLPLLWLREGEPLLALLAVAALGGAALIVAVLDDAGGSGAVRAGRRIARFAFRVGRGRLVRFGLIGVLIAAPTIHAPLDLWPSSWAAFVGTSKSPTNSLTAGSTFASASCWALPTPTPSIAYSFSAATTATTPTAELNVGTLSGNATYDAVLSSASLRVGGTCAGGNSPYVQFSGAGSEAVVTRGTYSAASSGTQSIWFAPTIARGVLFDLGSQTGTTAGQVDRQLYFTTGGSLAFVMRNGSSPVSCSIPTAVTLGAWHFAAVSYDSTTKRFVLSYDGSATSCTGTVTTTPTTTSNGRFGSDVTIAADASTGAYAGGIDEDYAWSAVLTPAQIDAVRANGH